MNQKITFLILCLIAYTSFSQTNTFPASGNVGIGTTNPKALMDVGKHLAKGELAMAMARLAEGDSSKEGTFLGVRAYATQGKNVMDIKSFALEHSFYGEINNSINFYRGGNTIGGYMTFNTSENNERVRIMPNGNIGIGTTNPKALMDVGKHLAKGELAMAMARLAEGDSSKEGTFLGVRAYATQGKNVMDIKSFALEHSFYGEINNSINFYRGGNTIGGYMTFNTSENNERMRIMPNGNVGIGTTNPDSKLTVKGNIHAQEVKVDLAGAVAPDYVFKEGYDLKTLEEVETHIQREGHLPNIPSAKEMEEDGINLKEMNLKLLEKVEELTLYVIEQQKSMKLQEEKFNNQIKELKIELNNLKGR